MRRVVLLIALCTVAGCSTEPHSPVGLWRLQTVNGAPLPFIVEQIGLNKIELTQDSYALTKQGTYQEITAFRETVNGVVSTPSAVEIGTYTVNGTAISLNSTTGNHDTAEWSGDRLAVTGGGFVSVYER